MEDLKKIQEFFSKPLEEGKQLDNTDFTKVVKAVEQTGHPVTVLLVPKFNEIEVLTGMDAPDDMIRDLSNAIDSLGYGRNDIIVAADSSNLSRREYSDIFRVNGGAKDYFEESVNEMDMNDPILMKMRAAKDKLAKMRAANAGDDGNDEFFRNAKKIAFLKKEREQLMRDMEQEAEPEGGPIADEYGSKLNRIDAAIAKLSGRKEMTYDQAIAEAKVDYDFSERELIRVLRQLKRGASTEIDMIKAFTKALGRDITKDELFSEAIAEGKGKMPTQDQVDRFFELTQNETHYLNSKPVAGQEATFNLMKVEPWDEYDLSNWNSLVRKAKAKGKPIAEASRARVSMPRFIKDKNNPNFLNVYIDYDLGPGGASIAFGKETMTGQIRRESAAEAMRLADDVARDLEAEYDLEDIDIQDLKNGKVRIFAVSDDFIDMNPNMLGEIKESLNPEVSNAVSRFIKAMAKRYDYSEQDAVYAIMAALKQRDFDGVNEAKEEDKIDIVTMDVPLFIRALEYAKEDAQEDMDLHDFAEKAIAATKEQGILQMDDYDMLVGSKEPMNELTIAEKVIAQLKESKPGLWANINAKQERGEKPSHGNSDAFKSAVKAGKKINKLNEDEEDQFAAELDGFADQLAAEIKDELEDHKEEIQKSDKEINEVAITVSIIGYILLSNTIANMLSKFAKKQFAKHNFGKGEEAAKKIYDFTHKNEEAFKAPIKRIVSIFTKDAKKQKMISDILYAVIIFLMAGQAGGEAVAYLKKASYLKGGIYSLKAAIKGIEVNTILKGAVEDAVS